MGEPAAPRRPEERDAAAAGAPLLLGARRTLRPRWWSRHGRKGGRLGRAGGGAPRPRPGPARPRARPGPSDQPCAAATAAGACAASCRRPARGVTDDERRRSRPGSCRRRTGGRGLRRRRGDPPRSAEWARSGCPRTATRPWPGQSPSATSRAKGGRPPERTGVRRGGAARVGHVGRRGPSRPGSGRLDVRRRTRPRPGGWRRSISARRWSTRRRTRCASWSIEHPGCTRRLERWPQQAPQVVLPLAARLERAEHIGLGGTEHQDEAVGVGAVAAATVSARMSSMVAASRTSRCASCPWPRRTATMADRLW